MTQQLQQPRLRFLVREFLPATNRITLEGVPYDEAIHKLEALGLKEKAESCGANRLGDRTRKVLAEEFGAEDEDDEVGRIVVG